MALVHDWVVTLGGAERVLSALTEAFPSADVHVLFYDPASLQRLGIPRDRVRATFLQRIPGVLRHYRKLLPLFPRAIESVDLAGYDLVVSSSHAVAKAARAASPGQHLCYCHTPMRYAWVMEDEYLGQHGFGGGLRAALAKVVLGGLRRWDRATVPRVGRFLANSRETAGRIRRFYAREATVVHPPVDLDPGAEVGRRRDHFLFVSRLVPYKRADLAVAAFTRLGLPLVVVGDGPALAACRRMAGPSIRFLGWQSDAVIHELMGTARALVFPAHEDFGIVPVEAQACGTPVIAYGRGGVLDTVRPVTDSAADATGIFFEEQTPEALCAAVAAFAALEDQFQPEVLRAHAARFARPRFVALLQKQAAALLAGGGGELADGAGAPP